LSEEWDVEWQFYSPDNHSPDKSSRKFKTARLGKSEFTNQDIYAFERELEQLHPDPPSPKRLWRASKKVAKGD
jgi:hypothetical protein